MKRSLSTILAVAILALPLRAQEQPQIEVTIECQIILLMDFICIWQCYDILRRPPRFPMDMTSPPPYNWPKPTFTNAPPTITNAPARVFLQPSGPMLSAPCDSFRWPDTNGGSGCVYTNYTSGTMQRSPTPDAFEDWFRLSIWASGNGRLTVATDSRDGTLLSADYQPWGGTNVLRLPSAAVREQQFYRMMSK